MIIRKLWTAACPILLQLNLNDQIERDYSSNQKDKVFMGVKRLVEVVNSASERLQRGTLSPYTAFVCIENYYPLVLGFDEMLDTVLGPSSLQIITHNEALT